MQDPAVMNNHEHLGQNFPMSLLLYITEGVGEMEVAQRVLLLVSKVGTETVMHHVLLQLVGKGTVYSSNNIKSHKLIINT